MQKNVLVALNFAGKKQKGRLKVASPDRDKQKRKREMEIEGVHK
jgi:hypothetical protein